MNLEEVEELYKKETESAAKEFTDAIKANKDRKKAEIKYKQRLADSREKYYRLTVKALKEIKKKPAPKKKKDNFKPFKADTSSSDISLSQKIKLGIELRWFKFRMKMRSINREKIQPFTLPITIRIKILFKKIKLFCSRKYDEIKNKVISLAGKTWDWIKATSIKAYKFPIELTGKIMAKLKKPKETPAAAPPAEGTTSESGEAAPAEANSGDQPETSEDQSK